MAGAQSSLMVNVAVADEALPHSSVAVKITVAAPGAAEVTRAVVRSVTLPQSSVAAPAPRWR